MSLKDLITKIAPFSVNERRTIFEFANGVELRRVQAFKFYPSLTSGANHYHLHLTEYFFVISGAMTLLVLEDIKTKEREVFHELGPGSLITVPPGIAHANCFAPWTIMVAGCSTARDKDDDDDHPYPLLDACGREISRP